MARAASQQLQRCGHVHHARCCRTAAALPPLFAALQPAYILHPLVPRVSHWRTTHDGSTAAAAQPSSRGAAPLPQPSGALDPWELTLLIKQCSLPKDIADLLQLHYAQLNYIHAAAALVHAAQLARDVADTASASAAAAIAADAGDPIMAAPIVSMGVRRRMQRERQAHGMSVPDRWRRELAAALPVLLDAAHAQLPLFQGRQVANSLWAVQQLARIGSSNLNSSSSSSSSSSSFAKTQLARMSALYSALLQQAQACWGLFNGQELTLLLYTLSAPPLDGTAAVAAAAPSGHDEDDHGISGDDSRRTQQNISLAARALQELQQLQHRGALRLRPRELDMLMVALRRLALLQQLHMLQQPASEMLQQQLSMMSRSPERCSTRDIAGVLHGCAALQLRPSRVVLMPLLERLAAPGATRAAGPADVATALHALAGLGIVLRPAQQHRAARGDPWVQLQQPTPTQPTRMAEQPAMQTADRAAVRALLQVLAARLPDFTPVELVMCLRALARLHARPPDTLLCAAAAAAVTALQPAQQREHALLLWALASLRCAVPPPLLNTVLARCLSQQQQHSSNGDADGTDLRTSAQHAAMLVWSCGRLSYRPPRLLLAALLRVSEALLPCASAAELAALVHGFAGMAVLPPAGWLDALSRALLAALPASSADDCSRVSSIAVEPTTTTTSSSSGGGGGGGGGSKSHHSAGQLDGQGLLMVSWAMARLGEQAGDRSPAMAPVGTPVQLLSAILSAPSTASLLWRAPEVAGPLLWACRRLGVLVPPPLLLDAAIYTLEASGRGSRGSNSSNRSSRSGSGRSNRSNSSTSSSMIGGNGSQHGRGPDMLRRLAQSVALAAWAVSSWLGDGSCKDDIRAQLLALLQANTALLRAANPTDLTTLVWALQHAELRPPDAWLLSWYSASGAKLSRFSDAQLACTALSLERLLLLPLPENTPVDSSGLYREPGAFGTVLAAPPVVWQLQMELQLRLRRSARTRAASSAVAEAPASSTKPAYDPAIAASGVLSRWRRLGMNKGVSSADEITDFG